MRGLGNLLLVSYSSNYRKSFGSIVQCTYISWNHIPFKKKKKLQNQHLQDCYSYYRTSQTLQFLKSFQLKTESLCFAIKPCSHLKALAILKFCKNLESVFLLCLPGSLISVPYSMWSDIARDHMSNPRLLEDYCFDIFMAYKYNNNVF